METIGLRDLNHSLPAVVARVAAGARLVIIDRGRPVADLMPHRPETPQAVRERMIADGSLRPARRRKRRLARAVSRSSATTGPMLVQVPLR